MPEAVHNYTLEQYFELVASEPEQKIEYINGNIRMMTGGSVAHGQVAINIAILLGIVLRPSGCNVNSSDVAVRLRNTRFYYPDVSVSCDPAERAKKYIEAPTVVVEVLSPSTESTDRLEKLVAYQEHPTIQDILYVDSRSRSITHYQRLAPNKWEQTNYFNNEDLIELKSIGVSFSLAEVYEKIYLEQNETQAEG